MSVFSAFEKKVLSSSVLCTVAAVAVRRRQRHNEEQVFLSYPMQPYLFGAVG